MKNLSGLIFILFAGAVHSATVTECGPNVCYEYDDAQIAASTSLFGLPTLIGDDMRFLPTAFKAQSIDGVGDHTGTNTDELGGTFLFDRIYSVSGAEIESISVVEKGDYEIVGAGNVRADMLLLVANNNDAQECDCELTWFEASSPTGLALWELSAAQNPSAIFSSIANDVSLSIQNTLFAFTDTSGNTAWIQKKFASTVTVNVVPVPAAAWLFGSALGLLGWFRRKAA